MNTLKKLTTLIAAAIASLLPVLGMAHESELKLENLMRSAMTGVDQREMIISRVSIPPHTSLPVHWHPGEEFAYVVEGSVTLWQQDRPEVVGRKGDVMKVTFKQVHTAKTGDEAAVILVVRIHEPGEPERVLVK